MTQVSPSSLGFQQEEVRTHPERHFDTNWSFCSPKTIIYMLTECSRLPFSCQTVPKWVLKFPWVTSDSSVTQDWQISQGSFCTWASGRWNAGWAQWPAPVQQPRLQSDKQHTAAGGIPAQDNPSLERTARFCFSSCSPTPSSVWVPKTAQEWQEMLCQ